MNQAILKIIWRYIIHLDYAMSNNPPNISVHMGQKVVS